MSSSIQRGLLSTVWMYGKEVWRCSVKQMSLLCSKRNSDDQNTTDESQEAIVSSNSADSVDVQAQPKSLKRTKRVRRKRGGGKSNAEPTTEEPSTNTTVVLDGDMSNRDAEKHTNTAKNKKSNNSQKRRRTKGKPANDTLLPSKSLIADSQNTDKDLDKKPCSSLTKNPAVIRKSQKPNNIEKKSCKSHLIVSDGEPKTDDDFSEWRVIKKVRKPCASRPDDVLHAKEQQTNKTGKSFPIRFEAKNISRNYNKPVDALKKSGGDTANTKPFGQLQCNTMELKSNDGKRFMAGDRQKFIHTKVSSSDKIKVDKSKNARFLTVATREAAANKSESKRQYDKTEELKKSVKWILKRLTEENVVELTKNLAALSIDTVELLQTTADVIFEKVLYERNVVHLYASLCADIKSLQVTCDGGKSTAIFLSLILKNCQKQFKMDRTHRSDGVKKLDEINSCKDYEKKKKLQLEYEANERRSRKRSIGNCRFIGELFKKNLIKTSIITYCIADLLEQSTECSLECLCILLKTAGTDLEKTCKLNETFDKLKSLKTISLRMRYIIKSTIDLWKKS